MSASTILIVEDDANIRLGLEEVLTSEGFHVVSCDRGDSVVEVTAQKHHPDLIILDVMLPGRSGFDACKDLRKSGVTAPILMLTAKGQEIDKVIGLESGADDYITKPFGIRELIARVNAHLRRSRMPSEDLSAAAFKIGDAEVNPKTFELSVNGAKETLTPKELELLRFFYQRRGEALSRDELLQQVWGVHYFGTTRTLDQTVAQLRKKIGDSGSQPKTILTVHGIGYKLAD